jgi:hypothetical protein
MSRFFGNDLTAFGKDLTEVGNDLPENMGGGSLV